MYDNHLIIFTLIFLTLVFAFIGEFIFKKTVEKHFKIKCMRSITGEQTARIVLRDNGVNGVEIHQVEGYPDYFKYKDRKIYLSKEVHEGDSISSMCLGAYAAGCAVAERQGNFIFKIQKICIALTWLGIAAVPVLFIMEAFYPSYREITDYTLYFSFCFMMIQRTFYVYKLVLQSFENSEVLANKEEKKIAARILGYADFSKTPIPFANVFKWILNRTCNK